MELPMQLNLEIIKGLVERFGNAVTLSEGAILQVRGRIDTYGVVSASDAHTLWLVKYVGCDPGDGWECDCDDYHHRQDVHGGFCKHVLAVLLYEEEHPREIKATPPSPGETATDYPEEDPAAVLYGGT